MDIPGTPSSPSPYRPSPPRSPSPHAPRPSQLPRRHLLHTAGALLAGAAAGGPAGAAVRRRSRPRPADPTPRQLAGQRVVWSYRGLVPPPVLLERIRAGEVAGVVFFADNIAGAGSLAAVAARLQAESARSPLGAPLLLLTDQEGGLVRRLPGGPAASAQQIGRSADPVAAAAAAGSAAGRTLAGAGLNTNLAPVLGVRRTSGGFLDRNRRSFGSSAAEVGRLGAAFITAQQRTGVAATAKHFPGLGAAEAGQDTDLGSVTLRQSLAELRQIDEAPYSAAIAAGVRLVMLSWAVYPALDAQRPAGLSATVVQQELRGRLGFTGVTVTDALEAGALAFAGGTAQRAVQAARAGMDLILCSSHDTGQGEAAVGALAAALGSGALDRAAFTAAADRVTALRRKPA